MRKKVLLWLLGAVVSMFAVSACGALAGGKAQSGQASPSMTVTADSRFAPFTEPIFKPVVVKTAVDSITKRMPGLHPTAVHFAGATTDGPNQRLPAPDERYWFHAVVTIPENEVVALAAHKIGTAKTLPGLVPELREYVPTDCAFVKLGEQAQTGLEIPQKLDKGFTVTEMSLSPECRLLLLTAWGYQ